MAKSWVWKVTGYGAKIPGNKYGNREGFKTIEVIADTKEEALSKAIEQLPENRREVPEVKQFVRVVL